MNYEARREHEEAIYNKYSDFFGLEFSRFGRSLSISNGWFPLVENMIEEIKKAIDEKPAENFNFQQIKQKFGALRVYCTHDARQDIAAIIRKYEDLSVKVCEICGGPGEQTSNGWISVKCPSHINTGVHDDI